MGDAMYEYKKIELENGTMYISEYVKLDGSRILDKMITIMRHEELSRHEEIIWWESKLIKVD